jgi:hypothetical protein
VEITRKQIEIEMIGHFGRARFFHFKLIGVNEVVVIILQYQS